jgi:hypothetical protein
MRRYIFLLIAIVLLFAQTLPTILSGRFTFAFDMGRDLLWVRNMVELKKPALIGPWGSIAGVYFGPLWYYLLAIPYTIFNGDPRAAVAVPLAANLLTIIIGWLFLRRRQHPAAADIFALLYCVSPMVVSLSSFAFHANLLPLVALIFFIGLYGFYQPSTINHHPFLGLPLSALSASLAYHLEPAAGVMLTIFLGLWLLGTSIIRKIKINTSFALKLQAKLANLRVRLLPSEASPSDSEWLTANEQISPTSLPSAKLAIRLFVYSFILFIIPFIPQIAFELRHDFIQSKSLVAYFQGENTSLGGVLPLSQRIGERALKLSDILSYSLLSIEPTPIKMLLMAIFLLLTIILSVIPAKAGIYINRFRVKPGMTFNVLCFTFYFLLFHYLAYTFLFPAELKNWYLSGFASLFILTASFIIESIFIRRKIIGVSAVAFLIVWNTKTFTKLIPQNNQTPAPETLVAQTEVVDWIYQDALKSAEPFSIYTYTPPIYDFTYQYLIWWRAAKQYGRETSGRIQLLAGRNILPARKRQICFFRLETPRRQNRLLNHRARQYRIPPTRLVGALRFYYFSYQNRVFIRTNG